MDVLFEELFYSENYKSFRVLCVSRPLEGEESRVQHSTPDQVRHPLGSVLCAERWWHCGRTW